MGTTRFLRGLPLFAAIDEVDLERVSGLLDERALAPGEVLFREGDLYDRAWVIRQGEVEIVKQSGNREVLLAARGVGEVIGEMALLDEAPRTATARARSATQLLGIPREALTELVRGSPSAALALFHTVVSRLRSTTAMLRQSEKMAQLGTLTAGIAHELNNPTAAVRRGASSLAAALSASERALEDFVLAVPSAEARGALLERFSRIQPKAHVGLSALARSDLEQALEDLLSADGVAEAWTLSPALVERGLDADGVSSLAELAEGRALAAALTLLGARAEVAACAHEIAEGSRRIGEVVRAMKSYSYLDQAPAQEVDIVKGLEDTLVILGHKLRGNIRVVRQLETALPPVPGWGGELNQVWTNLLDNAADALAEGGGTVTLRARREGDDRVRVEIEDDGPGIPPEVLPRVFDAFFTTKPPGKGTGLGLEISWRIVVDRHRGSLTVASRPGRTTFVVTLPLRSGESAAGPERGSDEVQRSLLERAHTIAVVGLSTEPEHPTHAVSRYLQAQGYRIVPIHPTAESVLGEPAHRSVAEAGPADLVLAFRPADEVSTLADAAISAGALGLWLPEGIRDDAVCARLQEAGLACVQDTCIRAAHGRLLERGSGRPSGALAGC